MDSSWLISPGNHFELQKSHKNKNSTKNTLYLTWIQLLLPLTTFILRLVRSVSPSLLLRLLPLSVHTGRAGRSDFLSSTVEGQAVRIIALNP